MIDIFATSTRHAVSYLNISWREALTLCGPLRGTLVGATEFQRSQLLDQLAVWINEGGAGGEPVRENEIQQGTFRPT
jgi:hypothetical protein